MHGEEIGRRLNFLNNPPQHPHPTPNKEITDFLPQPLGYLQIVWGRQTINTFPIVFENRKYKFLLRRHYEKHLCIFLLSLMLTYSIIELIL